MADQRSLLERFCADDALATPLRSALGDAGWASLARRWALTARPAQLPPPGDWRLWLVLAGRGFGKTRCGAEWVDGLARANSHARIALIGATHDDVRAVMVEGESGILSLAGGGGRPLYQPALRRITWPGGAIATCYSAAEPESLRGPQHHYAWADEIGRWGMSGAAGVTDSAGGGAEAAWDNLMFGLRLGGNPRVVATTTPRAVPLIRRLVAEDETVVTRGAMTDNAANLPPAFIAAVTARYAGTRLGRQEIDGELIEDVPGALWSRALIEALRVTREEVDGIGMTRIVIGVDPPAGSISGTGGDMCGIAVAALLADGRIALLEDASVAAASPAAWAEAVARAADDYRSDRIVAEANNGGQMVMAVLRAAGQHLLVRLVHASRGKAARAEPVAAACEQGRVVLAGTFPALEDQIAGLTTGGAYCGPGRSPDRADAFVWAATALIEGANTGQPGVRMLVDG